MADIYRENYARAGGATTSRTDRRQTNVTLVRSPTYSPSSWNGSGTSEDSGAIDFPSAVVYAVDLKPARAGGTIVRERLTGLGSSVAWLGDSDMLTRLLEASTGALWDRMHNVPTDASADRPIAGTIRLVSRYRCRDHAARLAGLRTAVGDLMAAWPRSAAA